MLGRFKRRLSRTKSVVEEELPDKLPRKRHTITPSVEELISGITFTEDNDVQTPSPRKTKSKHTFPVPIENNSERQIFNNVDSGFLALPTEVLLFLQPYLRPSSEVALRHTCSRFFLLFSLPSFYLAGEERFEFCCMTERDQDPTKLARLVCGVCRELHPRSSFPSAEIRSAPLARDCRQVWLCAHKSLGYQKAIKTIKAGAEAPFRAQNLEPCSRCRETVRNRTISDRPQKGISTTIDYLESEKAQALLVTKIAILQAPTPSYNTKTTSGSSSYREVFAVKDVVAALQAVDFRICPHIKLGDPYILSKFCRSCINTVKLPQGIKGPPCISETRREFGDPDYLGKCKQTCFSRHCKTKFMFQTRESPAPDASGQRQIWLIIAVYRWLGPLQSAGSEKTWQSHAVDHKERIEMRGKWEQWDKTVKVRRVMPNWEICLLHPEDCHVRS